MNKIDVDLIMKQIKEEAKNKEYPQEIISFSDVQMPGDNAEDVFDNASFIEEVNRINENYNISIIKVNTTQNPFISAIKKIHRSILVKVLKPVMYKQTVFNTAVTRAMNQILKFDLDKVRRVTGIIAEDQQDMTVEIIRLHQRIDELEKKITDYETRLKDVERKE